MYIDSVNLYFQYFLHFVEFATGLTGTSGQMRAEFTSPNRAGHTKSSSSQGCTRITTEHGPTQRLLSTSGSESGDGGLEGVEGSRRGGEGNRNTR
jgi:hypothetical protein